MSETIYDHDHVRATSYCGAFIAEGVSRARIQLTILAPNEYDHSEWAVLRDLAVDRLRVIIEACEAGIRELEACGAMSTDERQRQIDLLTAKINAATNRSIDFTYRGAGTVDEAVAKWKKEREALRALEEKGKADAR